MRRGSAAQKRLKLAASAEGQQLNLLQDGLSALLPQHSADLLNLILTTLKQPLFQGWGLWSPSTLDLYAREIGGDPAEIADAKQTWELAPLIEHLGGIGRELLHAAGAGLCSHEQSIRKQASVAATNIVLKTADSETDKRKLTLGCQLGLRDGEGRPGWEPFELLAAQEALEQAEQAEAARRRRSPEAADDFQISDGAGYKDRPLFWRTLERDVESRIYYGWKTNWYWSYGYKMSGPGPCVAHGGGDSESCEEDEDS